MQDAWDSLSQLCDAGAKPSRILLGIDMWWFLPNEVSKFQKTVDRIVDADTASMTSVWRTRLRKTRIFLFDQIQLLQNAWKDPRYLSAVNAGSLSEPSSGRELIGVGASVGGSGFRNDGSYRYTDRLDQFGTPRDRSKEVENGWAKSLAYRFREDLLQDDAAKWLERFLTLCQQQKIKVVVFFNVMQIQIILYLLYQ